jgi:hypothetical protein
MQGRFGKFEKMNVMEIKDLKRKIISEINNADKKDVLEEVLFLLNKNKNGDIIDALKWKEKIFAEEENLFKRLS